MFYVYFGYVSADNYDASEGPTYRISEFKTANEVIAFKKEFDADYIHDDCDHVIFRIFEGSERILVPKETVTEYVLLAGG